MKWLMIAIIGILLICVIWDTVDYQLFKKKLKPNVKIYNVVYDMWDPQDKGTLCVVTIERTDKKYVYGHFSDRSLFCRSKKLLHIERWKFNEIKK